MCQQLLKVNQNTSLVCTAKLSFYLFVLKNSLKLQIVFTAIGQMEKSCFISRNTLLQWINNLLQTNLTQIQELGSGSIYCHLLDAAYPNKVPLNRVKWNAIQQVDFIYNFKILQNCLQHLGIKKQIDISKLTKAKFQDNFQLLQWMYSYLSPIIYASKIDYNPLQRRKGAKINTNLIKKPLSSSKNSIHGKSTQNEKQNSGNKQGRKYMTKSQTFGTPSQATNGAKKDYSLKNCKNVNSMTHIGFSHTQRFSADALSDKRSIVAKQSQLKLRKQNTSKIESFFKKIVNFDLDGISSVNQKLKNARTSIKQRSIKDYKKHCMPLKQISTYFPQKIKHGFDLPCQQQTQYI